MSKGSLCWQTNKSEWGLLTDAQVWQKLPGKAETSSLTTTEGPPSIDKIRLVFLGEQSEVLERKSGKEWV